jgi:hypothetical protein
MWRVSRMSRALDLVLISHYKTSPQLHKDLYLYRSKMHLYRQGHNQIFFNQDLSAYTPCQRCGFPPTVFHLFLIYMTSTRTESFL